MFATWIVFASSASTVVSAVGENVDGHAVRVEQSGRAVRTLGELGGATEGQRAC